jgi:hypothetical protein
LFDIADACPIIPAHPSITENVRSQVPSARARLPRRDSAPPRCAILFHAALRKTCLMTLCRAVDIFDAALFRGYPLSSLSPDTSPHITPATERFQRLIIMMTTAAPEPLIFSRRLRITLAATPPPIDAVALLRACACDIISAEAPAVPDLRQRHCADVRSDAIIIFTPSR